MDSVNGKKKSQKRLHMLPVSCRGKRVLVRGDFDVEIENKTIVDDFRIRKVLPTIQDCLGRGGRVRIIAHMGRPQGKHDSAFTLQPIARHLERLLKRPVLFIQDPFEKSAHRRYDMSERVILFENIRFWPGEEQNNNGFANRLAQWGDLYINEAFANSHRSHASMVALAHRLPAYTGYTLQSEIKYLGLIRNKPKRPFIVILGGAKLETKMPLLRRFLKNADAVIIGGVLANTILAIRGAEIGKSKSDVESGFGASALLQSKKLHIPSDVVVAKGLRRSTRRTVKSIDEVGPSDYIVDIGDQSIGQFSSLLRGAKTIVWNGPLGYAEVPEFTKGTEMLARAIARTNALSVVGGGDTIAAIGAKTLVGMVTHVSTGGGAMLEFLSGEKLPALEALKR